MTLYDKMRAPSSSPQSSFSSCCSDLSRSISRKMPNVKTTDVGDLVLSPLAHYITRRLVIAVAQQDDWRNHLRGWRSCLIATQGRLSPTLGCKTLSLRDRGNQAAAHANQLGGLRDVMSRDRGTGMRQRAGGTLTLPVSRSRWPWCRGSPGCARRCRSGCRQWRPGIPRAGRRRFRRCGACRIPRR